MSCWPKGAYENLQITQGIVKVIGCSLQTDGKAPLLKTIPTSLTVHGEAMLLPN